MRFIPAGAGNTTVDQYKDDLITVYPRWRGEHIPDYQEKEDAFGLSPLARGTRPDPNIKGARKRFIPAGAGNTLNITYY